MNLDLPENVIKEWRNVTPYVSLLNLIRLLASFKLIDILKRFSIDQSEF